MLIAAATAIVAVSLGAALALVHGRDHWSMPALRAFALAAVVGTVVAHLLPEALDAAGPAVLIAFGLALVAPGLLGRVATRLRRQVARGRGNGRLAVELAYAALLVHKVTDGVGLGAALGPTHDGHHHWDMVLGIAGHTVPMAAVVALAFRSRGLGVAMMRSAGLALAIITGAGITDLAAHGPLADLTPWLNAVAAGLLLHIITHDLPPRAVRPWWQRGAEVLALAAGVAVPLIFGGHDHDHAGGAALIAATFTDLALRAAPLLAIGLVGGAALQAFVGARAPATPPRTADSPVIAHGGRLTPPAAAGHGGLLGQALRGVQLGAPLPLCSCAVLPVARALRCQGAPVATVVAFLLITPELALDTIALTGGFLGWQLALARAGAALAFALAVALGIAWLTRRAAPAEATATEAAAPTVDPGRGWRDLPRALDELVVHAGPWLLVGLVAAAYVEVLVPADQITSLGWGLALLVVIVLAVPSYVCASAATPLAAVLIGKGLSPGAAVAALLIGPLTNLAILTFLRRELGPRATVLGLAVAIAAACLLAAAIDASPLAVAGDPLGAGLPYPVAVGSAVVLVALAARTVWWSGTGAWLAVLHGHGHDHPEHDLHDREPGHGAADPALAVHEHDHGELACGCEHHGDHHHGDHRHDDHHHHEAGHLHGGHDHD